MPNHVRNVLKFKNLKTKEDVDFIVNTLSVEISDDDFKTTSGRIFDFDKVIPQPRLESDCPEDCKVNKDSHIAPDEDRPWFDWYTWNNKYWGTKWGAYDGYTIIGKSYVTFVFSTAWSIGEPVIEKLSVFGFDIDFKYADEDWGNNCDHISYSNRTGWIPEPLPKDMSAFARNLWRRW